MKHSLDSILSNAMSDFCHQNPGALQKIKDGFPTSADIDYEGENKKLVELYNAAASVIVEPEVWMDIVNEKEREKIREISDEYYEKCENDGMSWIKGMIAHWEDFELWCHVIDLVEENGY